MPYFRPLKNKQKLLSLLLLLVFSSGAIVLVEYFHHSFLYREQQQQQHHLTQELALVRANIESELYANVFLADSLATLITVNPQSGPTEWQKLSETLFLKATSLRNIAVAPNNVVRFVYPLSGNEAVLGLDYQQLPEQFLTIEHARHTQEIFIAGPQALVQGGNAIIARVPVFIDPPHNQQYWGICSLVVDVDKLFHLAGVFALSQEVELAIRGKNGTGATGEVFFGNPAVFNNAFATETIRLQSGSWLLAIAEKPNLTFADLSSASTLFRVVGYTLSTLLLLVLIGLFYGYQLARFNALQDPLTLLPNRRFAMQHLAKLITRHTEFSILNLDVDNFKQVNDLYGHAIGDALLQHIAVTLTRHFRTQGTLCRLSGDEFLVILPHASETESLQLLVREIHTTLLNHPLQINQITIAITLSIGCARFPVDADDLQALLHHADIAMYQQKTLYRQLSS